MAKLTASDAAAGDYFGISVAIDGDTVVVGALMTKNSLGVGAAYVFHGRRRRHVRPGGQADGLRRRCGRLLRRLRGHRRRHHRGRCLPRRRRHINDGSGSAYVFRTTDGGATYVQVAKLTASDAAADDYFGSSVAIGTGTVVEATYFRTTDGGL